MKKIMMYEDRITEKNIQDFADMLKDAASAKSYASIRAWHIGTDGTHDWAITAGWPDKNRMELRLLMATGENGSFRTAYAETGTDADGLIEYITENDSKQDIVQQLRMFLDIFAITCEGGAA